MSMTDEEFERREKEINARYYGANEIDSETHSALLRALKIERGAVIFVAMNEDGDYETGTTKDEAMERLAGNYGGELMRIVRQVSKISPPAIENGPTIIIPDTAGVIEVAAE